MDLFNQNYDRALTLKPYKEEEEYRLDLDRFINCCFTEAAACHVRLAEGQGPWRRWEGDEVCGLAVSQEEAVRLLDMGGRETDSAEACGQKPGVFFEDLKKAEDHMMGRLLATPGMGNYFLLRKLFLEFSLTKAEQFFCVLAFSVCRNAKYEAVLALLQGEGRVLPTIRTALSLYGMFARISEEERAALLLLRGAFFNFLAVGDREHRGTPSGRMYSLLPRVCSYLSGGRGMVPQLEAMARLDCSYQSGTSEAVMNREGPAASAKCLIRSLSENAGGRTNVLHLYGPRGTGRHDSVRCGAGSCGKPVIFIRAEAAADGNAEEIETVLRALILECRLSDAVLCLTGNLGGREEAADGEKDRGAGGGILPGMRYLFHRMARLVPFFVWISEEREPLLSEFPLHVIAVPFPMPSAAKRLEAWTAYSSEMPLDAQVSLLQFAGQYLLTPGAIREVLIRAGELSLAAGKREIDAKMLAVSVSQQSEGRLGRFASRINAVFTWEDLIIRPEQQKKMRLICDQVRYRGVVEEEWGFRRKVPYGRGISALFYGSPGTGKTMGAQVIANELGMDLYRIDLSQMVSKYIGETEKQISRLFERAKSINAILFFDEADALFGKRTEIKDSNDRFANSSTAQLLQRLEDYEGICILATNYVNNIDDAFKRRIRFLIHFTVPDPEMRRELFHSILPEQTPRGKDLDLDFFAEQFELSGSSIKEVLTNAAYLAAAESRELLNRHMIEAVKLNFAKYGRILNDDDFGYMR